MGLANEYERQIMKLTSELRDRECALIELGRESARRFDDGHDPAGSRVQRVLTDLRKLADRWERLTVLPEAPPETEPSELDALRARRAQRSQS